MKNYSFLAISSFLLGLFIFTLPFSEIYITSLKDISCRPLFIYGGMSAVLMGVIALFYLKKKGLKGKWLAILGIIFGCFSILITPMT